MILQSSSNRKANGSLSRRSSARRNTMESVLKIFLLYFALGNASKCPEVRKPHVTSCVIFYECINLPEDGYVWVPSKCSEGLVFQPYLRLCVLPGDSWTCNEPNNSTELSSANTPELIDKTKTSYHGLNSSFIQSAGDLTGFFNLGNLFPIMPYPLIETEGPNREQSEKDYEVQQKMPATSNAEDKGVRFNEFSRIFFYKNYKPSVTQTYVISPSVHIFSNKLFIQFIQNYILKSVNAKNNKKNMKNASVSKETLETDGAQPTITETSQIGSHDKLIDDRNTIVAIIGNLGNKEYVTIEKYKSLSSEGKIKAEFIPCVPAIPLPNATNCRKYYTCEPKTAEVHDFTCPQNTAFNAQNAICDSQTFKSCVEKMKNQSSAWKQREEVHSSQDNPCDKAGKFADKTSEKFYYLCYAKGSSTNIHFIRLPCPNNLIYCEGRKVCTSKRFCNYEE